MSEHGGASREHEGALGEHWGVARGGEVLAPQRA